MQFLSLIWPCLNVRPTPWFEEHIVKRGDTVRRVWIDASKEWFSVTMESMRDPFEVIRVL